MDIEDPNHTGVILSWRIVIIILNSILILYASLKLYRLTRKHNPIKVHAISRPVEITFFSLILLESTPRLLFGVTEIFRVQTDHTGIPAGKVIITVLEKLPPLIFISIISFITSSWQNTYTSFLGDHGPRIQLTMTKYEKRLIVFNIFLYAAFCVSIGFITVCYFNNKGNKDDIKAAICALELFGLVTITILLVVVGREFLRRVLARASFSSQLKEPSKPFKLAFRFLLFCSALKSLQQLLTMYSNIKHKYLVPAILELLHINDDYYGIVCSVTSVLFNLFGECGVSLILILILYINTENVRTQITERDISMEKNLAYADSDISVMTDSLLNESRNPNN